MNYEPLNRALGELATPVFPSSFDEIRTQMKKQFGEHGWIREFVKAEKGLTPSDGRKYQSARKQAERWNSYDKTGKYNPDRAKGGAQEKFREIGQTLPPIRKELPGQGVKIEIKFKSDGDGSHSSRNRTASVEMSGPELYDYASDWVNDVPDAKQPQYADLFDLWFDDGGDVYGEDGAYPADVTSVTIAA